MTSFVKFTTLIGANSTNKSCSYLLEIDDSKILLDCGYIQDIEYQSRLEHIANSVDVVLFSHGDMDHIGGYPLAVKYGLKCPSFATIPCHDMGIQLMRDYVKSKSEQDKYGELTLNDVDIAFDKMNLLRYSQPFTLAGNCAGIRITAYSAGHTIGGTVWKIQKDSEDIVYAIDMNHRKERHLNGTVLLTSDILTRPSLLITDAIDAPAIAQKSTKFRDQSIIDSIMNRISTNSNVLLPVETSTRVLELAIVLDSYWQENRISYHLVFLSHQSQSTINTAKNMLEWMGDGITQSLASREQAFDFRFLKCFTSLSELDELIGPKVVLTTFPGLEYGFSYDLFVLWASMPGNCVLFPQRPPKGTLGYKLYEAWAIASQGSQMAVHFDIPMTYKRRVDLEGQELEEHLEKERMLQAELEAMNQIGMNSDMDDSDSDQEEGDSGPVSFDIYVKDHQMNRKGFFKQSQVFRMYPVHEVRHRVDDYGELIDTLAFSKFEQKVMEEYMDVDLILSAKAKNDTKKESPFKYVESEMLLEVRCLVQFIDFEGRCDVKSLQNIIQQVSPKKLLLVHGTKTSTNDMYDYCVNSRNITNEIFCPSEAECISVSEATNLYQVVLTDTLLNEFGLAYVSGTIRSEDTPEGKKMYLDPLPPLKQIQKRPCTVGDLKISELNKHLSQNGFQTQFARGGVLVVNNRYVITKGEDGIKVQGNIHPEYYRLREFISGLQALLAA